jgi:hypothetical protein
LGAITIRFAKSPSILGRPRPAGLCHSNVAPADCIISAHGVGPSQFAYPDAAPASMRRVLPEKSALHLRCALLWACNLWLQNQILTCLLSRSNARYRARVLRVTGAVTSIWRVHFRDRRSGSMQNSESLLGSSPAQRVRDPLDPQAHPYSQAQPQCCTRPSPTGAGFGGRAGSQERASPGTEREPDAVHFHCHDGFFHWNYGDMAALVTAGQRQLPDSWAERTWVSLSSVSTAVAHLRLGRGGLPWPPTTCGTNLVFHGHAIDVARGMGVDVVQDRASNPLGQILLASWPAPLDNRLARCAHGTAGRKHYPESP